MLLAKKMSPASPSMSFISHLTKQIFFFSSLSQAVTVHDVFNVKGGKSNGGCDGQNIDKWFSDSQTLIDSAAAGAAATDADSRAYLKTFFNIGPTDDADQAGDPISKVKSILDNDSEPPGGKPWLFCNSDWLLEQKWTDIAYDPVTGQPRTNNEKIQDVSPKVAGQVPFWSDDLRQYIISSPGDYCSQAGNMAATQDMTAPSTVTLCINQFLSDQEDTLADIPTVTAQKTSISKLQVHSLNLFHEMFHLALGTKDTPDASYKLNGIVRLGTAKAIQNPESYALYALAYYLGQHTQYTFATSKSANKPVTPKRSVINPNDILVAFQPVKRGLPGNSWVA
ncbi:hypothetical protein F4677DRAFT_273640 [Hypoxylon crocopeplum]|nr:hypothetical protein F4677DRAFT_273640 [Hypoxylon crocopeplum]